MNAPDPRPAISNMDEARRARRRAALLANSIKPHAMVKHYPGGHVWRKYPHAEVVLCVKEALEI